MQVTLIGWALIPLGLFSILSRERLYVLMVFFIPFSATAVINIKSGLSDFGLQVTMFFGSLWVISEVLRIIYAGGRIKIASHQILPISLLIFFMITVLLSLTMPIVIDGKLFINTGHLGNNVIMPVTLTNHHIAQFLYLVYGVLITNLIALKNKQLSKLVRSLRIYIFSGLFVSIWGLMQCLLYYFNLQYPYFIFNNNINESAQGFKQVLTSVGLKRISSVAVEPSILAQFLLTVMPIVLWSVLMKQAIFSIKKDRIILFCLTMALMLSTSFTAYIGLLFIIFLTIINLYIVRKLTIKHLLVIIGLICLFIFAYLIIPPVSFFINEVIIGKMDSYSGQDRMFSITNSLNYFLSYPLLGIGWGSVNSHDMVIRLLANSGIIGLTSFVLILLYIFYNLILSLFRYKIYSDILINYLCGISISISTTLFVSMIGGFAYYFSHFWFILGISIALITIIKRNSISKNIPRSIPL